MNVVTMTGEARIGRRYVPDLSGFMAECELNYQRLRKLLAGDSPRRVIRLSERHAFIMNILEQSRYTTTVELRQTLGESLDWLVVADMTIRLYHDARLAEVIACTGMKRLRGVYEYPNPWMAHPDEKEQLNQFLGECLRECLRHGYEPAPADSA